MKITLQLYQANIFFKMEKKYIIILWSSVMQRILAHVSPLCGGLHDSSNTVVEDHQRPPENASRTAQKARGGWGAHDWRARWLRCAWLRARWLRCAWLRGYRSWVWMLLAIISRSCLILLSQALLCPILFLFCFFWQSRFFLHFSLFF